MVKKFDPSALEISFVDGLAHQWMGSGNKDHTEAQYQKNIQPNQKMGRRPK